MDDAAHAPEETQITCRFITELPEEYRVPLSSVAVPSKLTRYGLSQVINHLLGLDPVRPFDFLINGELVRLSLEKHLLARDISAESVLEVEYTFAVTPPQQQAQRPHDDWVSAVAGRDGVIVSGAYDGVLRAWHGAEASTSSSTTLHSGAVKALALLPQSVGPYALTAGQDQRLLLSELPALAAAQRDGSAAGAATPFASYRDHTDAVGSIACAPRGDAFASASWDTSLRVWDLGLDGALAAREAAGEDAAAAKGAGAKRRKGAAGQATPSAPAELPSRLELKGHSLCVSAVAWPAAGSLVSGSWDHSVRWWDVETGANTETHVGSKAVYCVAAAPGGPSRLVAYGGAERALRLWDARTPMGKETDQRAFSSHTNWIVAAAWHPTSQHHIATASYDHSVKLWDLRAAIPLHTLAAHADKALCVAWAGPAQLVSGGADCELRTYSVQL